MIKNQEQKLNKGKKNYSEIYRNAKRKKNENENEIRTHRNKENEKIIKIQKEKDQNKKGETVATKRKARGESVKSKGNQKTQEGHPKISNTPQDLNPKPHPAENSKYKPKYHITPRTCRKALVENRAQNRKF